MPPERDWAALAHDIKTWSREYGFQDLRITDTDVSLEATKLKQWIELGYHGEMAFLTRSLDQRMHPETLVPGTLRVLMVRMNYLPPTPNIPATRRDKKKAYIARYAVGGDYHTLIRKRLAKLTQRISEAVGEHPHRVFSDSAPVMEGALAAKAGLGWRGKNTLVLNREAGSYFFLGTVYTSLPLPIDTEMPENKCGSCTACLIACPTQALVAPYVLNATRCISYLTIELRGSIPLELRPLIGNRVYGCDECQARCPWNRFATTTGEGHFHARHRLDAATLIELFLWEESTFEVNTRGSAIRRIGYACWLRNMAIGLGNAPYDAEVLSTLRSRENHPSELVREHVAWAIQEQLRKQATLASSTIS